MGALTKRHFGDLGNVHRKTECSTLGTLNVFKSKALGSMGYMRRKHRGSVLQKKDKSSMGTKYSYEGHSPECADSLRLG